MSCSYDIATLLQRERDFNMKLNYLALIISSVVTLPTLADDASVQPIHQGYSDTAPYYEVNGFVVSNTDIEADLWNPRGKSDEENLQRVLWLAEKYDLVRTPEQKKRAEQARKKYQDEIAINSLIPSSVGVFGNTHKSFTRGLKRNLDAGITLSSASVYAYPSKTAELTPYETVAASNKVLAEQNMIKVDTTADIRRAKKENNLAVMYNAQGADYVVDDMDLHARKSFEAGIRAINFTYNNNNALAGGGSKQNMGLTDAGIEWLKVAQDNGIVVDVSHSSNQTTIEAAKHATKPIIASHSNAQGLYDVSRNISDEAIKAIGSTGGAVCPAGVGLFLNKEGDASPERLVEHVVYVANLIGKDKVCFSTDYVHNILDFYKQGIHRVDLYPPELGFGAPTSNIAPEHIWDVVALLEDEQGWTEEEIKGFLGENLMRVYAANWES